MNYWLLKTEPDDYSFDDLLRERRCGWEGVRNNQALIHLRNMRRGDWAFVYHTGKQRSVVGTATVAADPYPDPSADNERFVMVDIAAGERFAQPVPLARIKSDPAFSKFPLVTISRLSVMPVPSPLWRKICKMGGI